MVVWRHHERCEITVKKGIQLAIDDQELIELMRIMMDDDAEAALVFLKTHFKSKVRDLLEGG